MFFSRVIFELKIFERKKKFPNTEGRRKILQAWRTVHEKTCRHTRISHIQDRVTITFVGEGPWETKIERKAAESIKDHVDHAKKFE